MAIRLPELERTGGSPVWIFPELVVCLACNAALFAVPVASQRELITKPIVTGVEK
jgi:hypothetical protein